MEQRLLEVHAFEFRFGGSSDPFASLAMPAVHQQSLNPTVMPKSQRVATGIRIQGR